MACVLIKNRLIFVFSGVFTFLVSAYPTYAASALAANSFARSMFAAGFPLFGQASMLESTLKAEHAANDGFSVPEAWRSMGDVRACYDHSCSRTVPVSRLFLHYQAAAVILIPNSYIFFKYGAKLRAISRYSGAR